MKHPLRRRLVGSPRLIKSLALGGLTALLGLACSALPPVERLEVDLGLDTLFRLRGARAAPPEVVVVNISQATSRRLKLPSDPEDWPRSLHARLVRSLAEQGARVIAFDIIFARAKHAGDDEAFADAMRAAGNTMLLEFLQKEQATGVGSAAAAIASIERRIPPIPIFARAAAAVAPFPLPEVPAKVSQVWLFKPGAGDAATLPVVALQQYARPYYPRLVALINATLRSAAPALKPPRLADPGADTIAQAQSLRALLRANRELATALGKRLAGPAPGMDTKARRILSALISAYVGEDSRFVDLYGPPHSITTVPYHEALLAATPRDLAGAPVDLRGKAVFVGLAERSQPVQKDNFYTVFSRPDGLDVSGVEIAATTFANLLENRSVRPLPTIGWALSMLLWGLVVGALLLWLPGAASMAGAAALAIAWVLGAYLLFTNQSTWVPLVVPLAIELPAAMLGALLLQYRASGRDRRRLHHTLGLYLPKRAAEALVHDAGDLASVGSVTVRGVCMATDAVKFATLSESLPPDALHALLNRYFDTLFAPVRRHGGEISDVVGDAMLAVWSENAEPATRAAACHAALDILVAVEAFNCGSGATRLPTRIGLHCGALQLGNVGAGDHFEYRAVGDTVNAASRIEGLSKHLGTRILASAAVVEALPAFVTRELGEFRLAGKKRPLAIHELMGHAEPLAESTRALRESFALGLQAFRAGHWHDAIEAFEACLGQVAGDGPARYYLNLCRRYQRTPRNADWDGVVSMSRK